MYFAADPVPYLMLRFIFLHVSHMFLHLFLQSPAEIIRKYIFYRFLATGESYRSLAFAFRISPNYISGIVRTVLEQLCNKLVPLFMPQPSIAGFEKIATDFLVKWNFPNCVGAIAGKHIRIQCPGNSGSLYFNYKNFFSIVLLALVDANYKFIIIDVGSYGKEGDSGIFTKSIMGQAISEDKMKFPMDKPLPGSNVTAPHVIVGDEAFRLTKRMLKPYPKNVAAQDLSKKIFNYGLCRARRMSENAFGILSQTFRIFFSTIAVLPETTDNIITATCCAMNICATIPRSNNIWSQAWQ
ncbi:uncharacterized protein LOC143371063 [Andrena cerasifolii]|uniref:uncharacterized protein LOC143371063 n=1 Tax=Andrena cerasifolii TaxID=2819439 RepID=UPI004037AE7F